MSHSAGESLEACRAGTRADTNEAQQWIDVLIEEISEARGATRSIEAVRQTLLATPGKLIQGTDFGFLYDTNRHLFRVVYNVNTGEPDASYYDLLASEARLTQGRQVFGSPIWQKPLARRQMLKIQLPAEQSLSMWLLIAEALDHTEGHTEGHGGDQNVQQHPDRIHDDANSSTLQSQ